MSHHDGMAVPEAPAHKLAKLEGGSLRNPDPTYCSYYVSRKHRFCRTECKPGSLYCCTHNGTGDSGAVRRSDDGESSSGAHDNSSPELKGASGTGDVRVPCPINPNHTVYASRLAKHVRVCPDLRFVTTQLPYFSENKHANKGAAFVTPALVGDTEGTTARRTHRDLSQDDLARLMRKVMDCYRSCVEPEIVVMPSCAMPTPTDVAPGGEDGVAFTSSYPSFSEACPEPLHHPGSVSQKHGPQHTALLRCLSDVVLQSCAADSILTQYSKLTPSVGARFPEATPKPIHVDGFLEFGAGKGGLSVALQQLIMHRLLESSAVAAKSEVAGFTEHATSEPSSAPPSSWPFLKEVAAQPPLVVLDMDGFRRKGDARVRHSAVPLRRLRIDIKDVGLTQAFLEDIRPSSSSEKTTGDAAAAVEKAACTPSDHNIEGPMENWAVLGKHLCGACTDFALSCLTESPSLSHEAQVRLPIVIIATCCHHRCELRHLNPPETLEGGGGAPAVLMMPGSDFAWSQDEFAALTSMSSWAVCGGFVSEDRRLIGRQCKRIIDQLRVHFLRLLGYAAFQCQYTTRDITEENVCIVAFHQQSRDAPSL
ncbi:hypothetical protein ABL78_0540 [Leptomonas seymouri]|uniref:tRNA:m(4)X modification enzyme TRM13 n=1 Tax=Leptomonas seymouri TaxID=5684 RepID=A0A0N1IMP0_LEPSE|nr:hypothetical protein ABL78_0540 [Leptomonas seymouri]|eukprot:KPI90313.1 hypothetical protein ABL78_0540 [Leptomonas seymouri]